MKKTLSILLCITMLLTIAPITVFAESSVTYYIDSISGNDSASGTSERGAWKTTANIASLNLNAGDKDLFGNPITSNNIGCYGGDGTDAQYPKESLCEKAQITIKNIFETILIEIRYNVNRLIKKAIKYIKENFK